MKSLDSDEWIKEHSSIGAEKLHALGCVTVWWNSCEIHLFNLFAAVLGLYSIPNRPTAWTLAHDLGDVALATRIKTLPPKFFEGWPIEVIENALAVYDVCRQNRNQLTHFMPLYEWYGEEHKVSLRRRSKKPGSLELSPFADDIEDLRRVAIEIHELSRNLTGLWDQLATIQSRGVLHPQPPWLQKLPLPELLWKSAPPTRTKPPRPRRPSRA